MIQRNFFLFKNYFLVFYQKRSKGEQEKIDFVLDLIRRRCGRVSTKFLKKVNGTNGIYEIRVYHNSCQIRLLCFFHGKNLVLINAFVRNGRKFRRFSQEFKRAENIKAQYYSLLSKTTDKNSLYEHE